MSGSPSRWRFAVLPLVCLAVLLPSILRGQGATAAPFPAWVLLVIAGGLIVATLAAGWLAWRGARA